MAWPKKLDVRRPALASNLRPPDTMQATSPDHRSSETVSANSTNTTQPGGGASPANICEGDVILLAGPPDQSEPRASAAETLGDSTLSDTSRLLVGRGAEPHYLKAVGPDGIARALVEVAEQACISIDVDEETIPAPSAREARQMDRLSAPSNGQFLVFVPHADTERALDALRSSQTSQDAHTIGSVWAAERTEVCLAMIGGATRILDATIETASQPR